MKFSTILLCLLFSCSSLFAQLEEVTPPIDNPGWTLRMFDGGKMLRVSDLFFDYNEFLNDWEVDTITGQNCYSIISDNGKFCYPRLFDLYGHPFVYEWQDTTWVYYGEHDTPPQSYDWKSDNAKFSDDGKTLLLGKDYQSWSGVVKVIHWDDELEGWAPKGQTIYGKDPGHPVGGLIDMDASGNRIALATYAEEYMFLTQECYIYDYDATLNEWILTAEIIFNYQEFPSTLSPVMDLATDGSSVIIGNPVRTVVQADGSVIYNGGGVGVWYESEDGWQQRGNLIEGTSESRHLGQYANIATGGTHILFSGRSVDTAGYSVGYYIQKAFWTGQEWKAIGPRIYETNAPFSLSHIIPQLSGTGEIMAISTEKEGSNERINRFYGNLGDGCIFPKTVNELWSGGIAESVVYQIPDSEKYLSYPVDPQTCAQGDLYSIWLRFDGTGAHYRLQVEHESEIYWSLFSGDCENLQLQQCGQGSLPSNLHAIAEKNYRLLLQKEGPFTGEINLEAIKLGPNLGKEEYDASYSFSIFPNPATEIINLHREVPLQEPHSGIIYNGLGQAVQQFTIAAGQVDWRIPITALAHGVYFVAVSNGEGAVYYEQVLLY